MFTVPSAESIVRFPADVSIGYCYLCGNEYNEEEDEEDEEDDDEEDVSICILF